MNTNRHGLELDKIKPGMYIVYQIGTAGVAKITEVQSVGYTGTLNTHGFYTRNGYIHRNYVIGQAVQYSEPAPHVPRERFGIEHNGHIVVVFKHRHHAEEYCAKHNCGKMRIVVFREVMEPTTYSKRVTQRR